MAEPILQRLELSRLPFKRRPVAQPSTTLVFQMADGRVMAPAHPYTTGETWWRGPKYAFVVDRRAYGASFVTELPTSAAALYFTATVDYTWSVHDPAAVVGTGVGDPEPGCRAHLERLMPQIAGRHSPLDTASAERALRHEFGHQPLDLSNGIRMQNVHVRLRMDSDQAALAKEQEIGKLRQTLAERDADGEGRIARIRQQYELALQAERQQRYLEAVGGGRETMMALVIAQHPDKAPEILDTMIGLSEREEMRTLEAIKVLIDGGEIRLGELDGAVSAAVSRISAILGKGLPAPGGATEADKQLPAGAGEES
ncbi:hypothetical protein [Actinoplanes sp. RD1]|uniref:hypothetical protein n=1 Tax=Actinoplanes sp. RD1 TaxID=3064538 RepID=UPI00274286E8|nr:hypothetical protein [Actinoplanes sp. RD1]